MQGTQLNTIGSGKLDHCYATCIGVVDDLHGNGVFKGRDLYKWGRCPMMCVIVCMCVWVYMYVVCVHTYVLMCVYICVHVMVESEHHNEAGHSEFHIQKWPIHRRSSCFLFQIEF